MRRHRRARGSRSAAPKEAKPKAKVAKAANPEKAEDLPAPVPIALANPEPEKLPVAQHDRGLTRFDGLAMAEETELKIGALVNDHGIHNVHSVVWMPNRADNHRRHVPSGFAFAVRKSRQVPIVRELFNPNKFFYGTLAVRVPSAMRISGGTTFRNWAEATSFPTESFGQLVPDGLLDFPGSYAGVYRSMQRRPFAKPAYENEYWLVLQCGSVEQSQILYKTIEEGHSYEHPWAKTFFGGGNNLLAEVGLRATEHRRAALFKILQGLGLEMGNRTLDSFTTLETVTNFFDLDHNTDTYVYYSGCTSLALQGGGGLILGERPDLGPSILRGPGGKRTWTVPDACLGAFPVGTGRVLSVLGPWSDDEVAEGPFCWDGGHRVHPRLRTGVYRTRDTRFMEIEARLGYNHMWQCQHLQPLAVKLASPDIYENKRDFI